MSRQIYNPNAKNIRTSNSIYENEYQDRLIKLIPGDIVAVYLSIKSIIDTVKFDDKTYSIQWGFFVAILIIAPFYFKKISGITDTKQIFVLIVAFIIWAISLGTPFVIWKDATLIGAILAGLFTLAAPMFYKGV